MAAAVERTDELVREYLLFRGFTATLKQLDVEIKADKEKGFRVRGREDARRAGAGWREQGKGGDAERRAAGCPSPLASLSFVAEWIRRERNCAWDCGALAAAH